MVSTNKQTSLNLEAAKFPLEGDFWHEMFTPICFVAEATEDHVITAETIQRFADGSGIFTADRKHRTRAEFEAWLSYKTIPGTWPDVIRK